MREGLLRNTALGVGIGAAAFTALGLYLNVANGAHLFSHPGPLTVLAVVGGTIGGLVGPLFRKPGGRGSNEKRTDEWRDPPT